MARLSLLARDRVVAQCDSDRKMTENVSLSWALVHSKHPHDVQRGIAMLEVIEDAT
ncbi:hypothetical protein ZOSMA_133G00720 [Zostera marina]|uniref:Uncharacterized protein n=1 Tax=Zostera marina TaxID=29655 RepID=A0A0K9PYU4_ZOSMR|nr:hypothetical protein ZOSMA_133G00720 [Zostera marina]